MRRLYISIALLYVFFNLTGLALNDLFGLQGNIFIFILVGATIMLLDIFGDHIFHHTVKFYVITPANRFVLSLYAFVMWIFIEGIFTGLQCLFTPDLTLMDFVYFMKSPSLFITGAVMSIAVWFSLGYVLSEASVKNAESVNQSYLNSRKTKANIAEQVKLEKEKVKDAR